MTKTKNVSPLLKRNSFNNAVGYATTALTGAAFTVSAFVTSAYADELGTKIKGFLKNVYGNIKDVFDVAAILAVSLCLFFLLFGRSDKTAEKAYSWLFKIVVAFVIFHSLGWLVTWLKSAAGTNDYNVSNLFFIPISNLIT